MLRAPRSSTARSTAPPSVALPPPSRPASGPVPWYPQAGRFVPWRPCRTQRERGTAARPLGSRRPRNTINALNPSHALDWSASFLWRPTRLSPPDAHLLNARRSQINPAAIDSNVRPVSSRLACTDHRRLKPRLKTQLLDQR